MISHAVSGYGSLTKASDVAVVVDDDEVPETPGVDANPLSVHLEEGGQAKTYMLVLRTKPGGTVTVTPVARDTGAVKVSGVVTWGADNWESARTVTVTPRDDSDTNNEAVAITHTVTGYGNATSGPTVMATVSDDDPPTPPAPPGGGGPPPPGGGDPPPPPPPPPGGGGPPPPPPPPGGDGKTSRSASPSHAWGAPGFYEVALVVGDGSRESEVTRTFLVEAGVPAGTCEANEAARCLLDSRFEVTLERQGGAGELVNGSVVPVGTDGSGLFTFFDPENWEILVKVLDGRGPTGHYWVFAAATTDLGFVVRVRDTATGRTREYENEHGNAASAVADTKAFACSEGQAR